MSDTDSDEYEDDILELIAQLEETVERLSFKLQPAHLKLAQIRHGVFERLDAIAGRLGAFGSPVAPPQPDQEEDVPSSVKREAKVIARRDSIVTCLDDSPIPASQVVRNWTPPTLKLTHACAEDLAFQKVLRGYQNVSLPDWCDVLASYTDPRKTFPNVVIDCGECGDLENIDDRLVQRSQILFQGEDSKTKEDFLTLLVRQVEAVKFAIDWNLRGDEVGGKRWKGKYFTKIFEEHPSSKDLHPDDQDVYRAAFKKFKTKHERVVTARNRLLLLYDTFGVGILLDPLWDVGHIYTHRSRLFLQVFESLRHHISTATLSDSDTFVKSILVERHPETTQALLHVAGCLGGMPGYEYVKTFVETFPPDIISDENEMSL
ncbi:hypothetical protein BJ138DRAFT_1177941 [Hygrophoropsis aurantiaca]|uniref:Uncharacterized protein n=1 Tax=Hygrophoropsis aurantiaca TaxID=72124 RepID=A0ACB8AK86_9AGAM|nr:hypothetical protein BJ138DRAFT_1177941 [Hygrophoropsis aurantiaca]